MSGKSFPTDFIRFVSNVAHNLEIYSAKDGKDIYVYDAKLTRIIANYFVAQYEILTPPDGQVGVKGMDGNWTGIIDMVLREEADLAMSSIAATEERFHAINYSYPFYYSTLSFMTDAPQPMPKNLAIFHPFSCTMWAALVGITIAMSFVFYFLLDRRHTYQRVLLSTFRSTLGNSIDFKMTKSAVKVAAFAWILSMFVVTNGYKAVLLSFLSFPTMMGVRDISELSRAASSSRSFTCLTYTGTYLVEEFARNDDPSWKAIGECLLRNKMSGDPLANFVTAPYGKAFIGSRLVTLPFEKRYFLSEDEFFIEQYGIPFSKTFCCPEELNRVLHRLVAAGIFEKLKWESVSLRVLKNPLLQPEYSEAITIISLGDISGAFYILISGWMSSIIILLIEIFVQKNNN